MASTALVVAPGRYQLKEELTAWEAAKARFMEDLDPSERKLFDTATAETLFYSTSNAQKQDAVDSKIRRAMTKLSRFTSVVELYGKAIDTYAQISPLYVSPIWGSIRVVIVLANKHDRFFSNMVDTLTKIGELLPQFGM